MKKQQDFLYQVWYAVYVDGDGNAEDGAAEGGAAEGGAAEGSSDEKKKIDSNKKTFTQEELNSIISTEKRKYQEQQKKALDELKALQTRASLTKEERDALDKRVEEMNNQLLTKEELSRKEKEKILNEHKKQTETLTSELKAWQNRYQDTVITAAITTAAAEAKAYSPEQVIAILRSNTTLKESVDEDGKPSGKFEAIVKFSDVDSKGKPVILDLTPTEAVKRMRDMDKYQNLFIAEGTGGVGGNNQGRGGKDVDPAQLAKDPVAYREWRKKQGFKS